MCIRDSPEYRLDITESDSREVVEKVARGEIEVGFTGMKMTVENCVFEPFYICLLYTSANTSGSPSSIYSYCL